MKFFSWFKKKDPRNVEGTDESYSHFYAEGQTDHARGVEEEYNPYKPSTHRMQFYLWRAGWHEADNNACHKKIAIRDKAILGLSDKIRERNIESFNTASKIHVLENQRASYIGSLYRILEIVIDNSDKYNIKFVDHMQFNNECLVIAKDLLDRLYVFERAEAVNMSKRINEISEKQERI